ncbi:MAG: hypothetical protein ACD_75C01554G0001 [uncultured bacterium]|nr:MAG: hypothetical protein ACD_75C01554G0001 [uncultured bacterium]
MGPGRFDDVMVGGAAGPDGSGQFGQGRQQGMADGQRRGEVEGGGDDIVAALAEVDVIVG